MKEWFAFAVIPDIHLEYRIYCWWDRLVSFWNWLTEGERGVVGEEIEKRLLLVVNLINSIPEIKFVMTTGDLTQDGTIEQRLRVKEILDGLRVPWVPQLGNHELLPYTTTDHWGGESKGIIFFEEVFKENFQLLSNFFEDWEKPQSWEEMKSQGKGSKELLENYGFSYQSTRFIVVDNVNRRSLPFFKRTQQIFLCRGSKEWLKNQLAREEERKIIFSHSPLSSWLLKPLSGKSKIVLNIAGHWHIEKGTKSDKTIGCSQKSITTLVTSTLYLKPVILVVKVLADEIQVHPERIL